MKNIIKRVRQDNIKLTRTLIYKILSKIRYNKMTKLIRRLHLNGNPVNKALILIKQAQAASQECEHAKNSTLVMDGQCILIPAFRNDGVGIQAVVRIVVMFLARQTNATYVHLPFLNVGHQKSDNSSSSLTPKEWNAKWEAFLNLGKDEFHIGDLANTMGQSTLAKHLSAKKRKSSNSSVSVQHKVKKVLSHDSGISEIFTFGLGLCRKAPECQLFPDAEFIQILQEKFETNGYTPKKMLYNNQYLNIAIHIRQGDVWNHYQSGSREKHVMIKFVNEEYYVGLLHRLQNIFGSSPKPVRFHIFSDGLPENFGKFEFTGEHEASLKLESGLLIENIQFHLRQDTFDTLYNMIKAPIFVPGKSTFSVLAVILSNSYVLYENEIWEYFLYDLLEKYIEGNPRFISLNGLDEKIVHTMETLTELRPMD